MDDTGFCFANMYYVKKDVEREIFSCTVTHVINKYYTMFFSATNSAEQLAYKHITKA